jgi:hypothetical protein
VLVDNKSKKCTEITCFLCPQVQGAIKKIKRGESTSWAHVVCVNWLPEIWFIDGENC